MKKLMGGVRTPEPTTLALSLDECSLGSHTGLPIVVEQTNCEITGASYGALGIFTFLLQLRQILNAQKSKKTSVLPDDSYSLISLQKPLIKMETGG